MEIGTKSLKITCKGVHFFESDLKIVVLQILNRLTGIFGYFILRPWKSSLNLTDTYFFEHLTLSASIFLVNLTVNFTFVWFCSTFVVTATIHDYILLFFRLIRTVIHIEIQKHPKILTLICMKYFYNFPAWNGSLVTKGNAQLTRQNDILSTWMKLVYCLTKKALHCNSLIQKIYMFLQKNKSYCKINFTLGAQGPKQYIFGDHFYIKNTRKLGSMYFSFFMGYHHFTLNGLNSQDIVNFTPIVCPRRPEIN